MKIMKRDKGFKIKLGIFVVAGLVLVLGALYFIGQQQNLFRSTFQVKSNFRNVGGLVPGNKVQFAGINVGTVSHIHLVSDSCVTVTMLIEEDVHRFIKKDASASIGSEGLMGNKIVVISPGVDADLVAEAGLLESEEPPDTDAIIESLQATAVNAEIVTDQLAEILYKINNGNGAISRLLSDSSFARDMTRTMTNLKRSSKSLDENLEAAKESILLRGYFKKREREARKKKNESQ